MEKRLDKREENNGSSQEKKPQKQALCSACCPECGAHCISKTHFEWKHECVNGHRWWMKYCYSL